MNLIYFIYLEVIMKKTKVICTMGPNTNDRELIKQLALSGMDIARFNLFPYALN